MGVTIYTKVCRQCSKTFQVKNNKRAKFCSRNCHHINARKRYITKEGYIRINVGKRRILEHRYIMEKFICRKLKPFPTEVVHHKNEIKTDNRIENLELTGQSEHAINHGLGTKCHINWKLYKVPKSQFRGKDLVIKSCLIKRCKMIWYSNHLCRNHFQSWYKWKQRTHR